MLPRPADYRGKVLPAPHRLASQRQHLIAWLQARRRRGGIILHLCDYCSEVRYAIEGKDQGEDQKGKDQVEGRPGQDDEDAVPKRMVHEGVRLQLRRNLVAGVFPQQLDITPQGHHRQAVVGVPDLFMYQLRGETQGEGLHPNPQKLG